jgi:hypothetical protein
MEGTRSAWMAMVSALVAIALAACGSTSGKSRDGAALGTPYPCTGGFLGTDGGGVVTAPADAGPAVTCVVGQSYCMAESSDKVIGVLPGRSCDTLADGGLGVCKDTPTCACICGQGVFCITNCACDDSGGFVRIACHQI